MDIWIVAAAAGAGYIAQHWKNLMKATQGFPNSPTESTPFTLSESSPIKQQAAEKNCLSHKVLPGKKVDKDAYSDRDFSSQDATSVKEASTSGYDRENLAFFGSSSSSSTLENLDYNIKGDKGNENDGIAEANGDLFIQPSKEEGGICYGPIKKKSALRTHRIRGQVLKPLNSLESCLMAQLYKEHSDMDDYVLSYVHSPQTPTAMSFGVAVGSKKISGVSGDSMNFPVKVEEKQPQKFTYSEENLIYGIPQLPNIGNVILQRGARDKLRSILVERSSDSSIIANGEHENLEGPSHGTLLFCLGISVGVLSSFFANQHEVDKLNELLKQSENLVQDLQEELEMKDSVTVQELAVEDDESQDTHNDYLEYGQTCYPEHKLHELKDHYQGKCHDEEAELKSFSKIEAELEAELERLEINMTASSLEQKLTDLVELDREFVPDVAVGEFRADLFSIQAGAQAYADQDGSGGSTPHPANYAVSPRELSLRLHEVVQSRLEERVKELETALQNSQRKFQHPEYEHSYSLRKFSGSEAGSSSHQESPVNKNEPSCADDPVVINLSREALDTNDDAHDLSSKLDDARDDKSSGIISSSGGTGLHLFDQSPYEAQNGQLKSHMQSHTDNSGSPATTNDREDDSHNSPSRNESDDSQDDEMEKLLIQHIIGRARKSSSVLLNAQKALLSGDDQNV